MQDFYQPYCPNLGAQLVLEVRPQGLKAQVAEHLLEPIRSARNLRHPDAEGVIQRHLGRACTITDMTWRYIEVSDITAIVGIWDQNI